MDKCKSSAVHPDELITPELVFEADRYESEGDVPYVTVKSDE